MFWKRCKKVILSLLLSSSLFGCAKEMKIDKDLVTVCLLMGDHFVARSYVNTALRGSDITFQYTLLGGYEASSCSYSENYTIEQKDTSGTLTLSNVKYSCRVSLECILPQYVIHYDYNGGKLGEKENQSIHYPVSLHPRINVSTIHPLKEGYSLTGWNTSEDGKGEHISLGSRITMEKNEEVTLFAQWEKESPLSSFRYESKEDGIHLLKYLGEDRKLVIPSSIENQDVVSIDSGFVSDLSIDELILPNTIMTIEKNAFSGCEIQDIYFFDSLSSVSDDSFSSLLPHTWHINASLAPRYLKDSSISVFADKMDLLMLSQDKKKLVLYAGCSMFYGLDSELLKEQYPDYTVLNLGVVGGTNASFQFDCIDHYLKKDDVFLHAPEQASSYQLMDDVSCENRVFVAVEGNFDLLTLTDMALMKGSFDCFNAFNHNRSLLSECTYEDGFSFNEFGDYTQERVSQHNNKQLTDGYGFYPELVNDTSLNTLCGYYDRMKDKGVSVYVSYAPINRLCTDSEDKDLFALKLEEGLNQRGYQVISDVDDYVFEPEYFYDTDYHLTDDGASERTKRLQEDLQSIL